MIIRKLQTHVQYIWNKNEIKIFKCCTLVNGLVKNTEGHNELKELISWETSHHASVVEYCYWY